MGGRAGGGGGGTACVADVSQTTVMCYDATDCATVECLGWCEGGNVPTTSDAKERGGGEINVFAGDPDVAGGREVGWEGSMELS